MADNRVPSNPDAPRAHALCEANLERIVADARTIRVGYSEADATFMVASGIYTQLLAQDSGLESAVGILALAALRLAEREEQAGAAQ